MEFVAAAEDDIQTALALPRARSKRSYFQTYEDARMVAISLRLTRSFRRSTYSSTGSPSSMCISELDLLRAEPDRNRADAVTGVEAEAEDAVGGGDGEASDAWLRAGLCATGSPAWRCAMLPRGDGIEENGEVELEAVVDVAGQASRAPGDEAEESPGETDATGGDDRRVVDAPFAAALDGADSGASNAEYHETVPRLLSFSAACCAATLSL